MRKDEKMKKDKYKIQIGDAMFEASKMYNKVIQHTILDIYFEKYVTGYKTVVVTESYLGKQTKYASDVCNWYDSLKEAEEALNKR